jgi:hypothetical protein
MLHFLEPRESRELLGEVSVAFFDSEAFRFNGRFFRPGGTTVWIHSNLSALRTGPPTIAPKVGAKVDARSDIPCLDHYVIRPDWRANFCVTDARTCSDDRHHGDEGHSLPAIGRNSGHGALGGARI